MTAEPHGRRKSSGGEAHAFRQIVTWSALIILWSVWFVSLQVAGFMLLVFDGEVSVNEGAMLGAIQATWVAGIPVGLLALGHLLLNGGVRPRWRLRWIAVAGAVVLSALIFAFWILASATDDDSASARTLLPDADHVAGRIA